MRIPDTCLMELTGMEFHAYHGCFEQERAEGNLFVVDLSMDIPLKKAAKTDSLSSTVDYGDVYKVVREQMEQPSNLLEHVAWRILEAVCGAFPEGKGVTVKVSKQNPPVGGTCRWSSVTVKTPEKKTAKK